MHQKLRVLIVGYHSRNKGDEAALTGLIETLSEERPDLEVVVLADHPESMRLDHVPVKVSGYPWVIPISEFPYKYLPRKYDPVLGVLNVICWSLLNLKRVRFYMSMFRRANLILFSPGGPYFGILYIPYTLIHLFHLFLCLLAHRPIVICAPSMGPFRGVGYSFFHRILLNHVDLILVRDPISGQFVRELGLTSPKVVVSADNALLQSSIPKDQAQLRLGELGIVKGSQPMIGVSVMTLIPHFSNYREYKTIIARLLNEIIEKLGATIVFFASEPTDVILIAEIAGLICNKDHVKEVPFTYTSRELELMLSVMDFVIASRLHSYILAAKSGIPGIVIVYAHKAIGFMQLLQLAEFTVDLEHMSLETLRELFWKAWSLRQQLSNHILSKIPCLIKKARANASLPLGLVAKKGAS